MAAKTKNIFRSALQERQQEQEQLEAVVTGVQPAVMDGVTPRGKIRKRGANATSMTLSCSQEDKIKIKKYAAERCMSVSDVLHSWIVEHCGE